jgi:VanZ family protein
VSAVPPSEVAAVATTAAGGARRHGPAGVLVALALAVAVQLVVLYLPEGVGPPPFPQADKLAHVTIFLVPVALAVVAGWRRWAVAAVFGAHALLSEVVQSVLLPHRSGDPLDAVADLTGVALGVVVGGYVLRVLDRRESLRS